jgi:hypothetical protein
MDGFCPARCGTPQQEVVQIKGVWYGTSEDTKECLHIWTFDDLGFTSLVQITKFANPSTDERDGEGGALACPSAPAYGGRRYGSFNLDTSSYPAKLTLVYDDDLHTKAEGPGIITHTRRAAVYSNCPQVR